MQSVKILHCADLHIGALESFLGASALERRFETLLTFEKIINTAKDNGVNILLIAGDLFDSNDIEPVFVDRVIEGFCSIPEIKIVYSAGNHDPLNAMSPFYDRRLPENLYILKTKDSVIEFGELKTRVYGKSFGEMYLKGEPLFSLTPPDDDFINIMNIHGELRSDLNSEYNSITSEFISKSKMDYIALGHIHRRTEIGKIGNTYCAYCGCPEGQGFDELDEKGVYLGEISKGKCNLEFIKLCYRMHIRETINISEYKIATEISQYILSVLKDKYGEDYGKNLYKIILTGEIDDNVQILTSEILSRLLSELYFVKLSDNTEVKIDMQSLTNEKTLRGIFAKKMCEKIESAKTSEEKDELKYALSIGLKAFKGEVNLSEDK